MARLSTHILDISRGAAASGVVVELHKVVDAERQRIVRTTTNADGRTDAPLLSGERIETGVYELTFHAGDYFRGLGVPLPEPAFLDAIVIRVGLADATGHYHVPLLLSPWGYSTYRGT